MTYDMEYHDLVILTNTNISIIGYSFMIVLDFTYIKYRNFHK